MGANGGKSLGECGGRGEGARQRRLYVKTWQSDRRKSGVAQTVAHGGKSPGVCGGSGGRGGGPEQRGLYVKTWESGRGNQEGLIGSAPGCPGFESDIIHSDPSICIYV